MSTAAYSHVLIISLTELRQHGVNKIIQALKLQEELSKQGQYTRDLR